MDTPSRCEGKTGRCLPTGRAVVIPPEPIPLLVRGVVLTICALTMLGSVGLGVRLFMRPEMLLARQGLLIGLALLLTVLGILLRAAARRLGRGYLGAFSYGVALGVPPTALTAACLLPALAVPLSKSWPLPLASIALWIAAELILYGRGRLAGFRRRTVPVPAGSSDLAEETSGGDFPAAGLPADSPDSERENIVQQSIRRRDGRGAEMISGTVRGDLPAGAQRISLHVVFCPALAVTPRVEAEPIGGPWSEIEAIHPYPHGVRFDIKLAAPTPDEAAVTLQYYAIADPE